MSINTVDKIYFAYTPYINPADSWDFRVDAKGMPHAIWYSRARATIALQKVGNDIHYGIAVCSEEDNFMKKEGRAMAEARLKSGYGKYTLDKDSVASFAIEFQDEHEVCLYLLRNMANSVAKDIRKTQQKIGKKKLPKETKLLTAAKETLHKV